MTNLNIYVNNSSQDVPLGSSGVLFTQIVGSDYLIFTNGSTVVADGNAIPSSFQLSSASIVLNGTQQVIPTYILADVGSNLLRKISLMGPGNYQHVLAFSFSGATTSEPVLEIWDNSTLSTANIACLGGGTPNNSWFKGICTTSGTPGASWTGSPLAGSTDGNYLLLNNANGALTGATTLYANLQVIVPASQLQGVVLNPTMVVKYTTT